MAHTVFICHSSKDKSVAAAACAALEARRIPCWMAPRDVLGGTEYMEELDIALSECHIVLLIFSQNANDSPQVRREIERAVSYQKIVLPFRIEDALPTRGMKFALSNTHWLDALTPPLELRLTEMCNNVARLIARDSVSARLGHPSPLRQPLTEGAPVSDTPSHPYLVTTTASILQHEVAQTPGSAKWAKPWPNRHPLLYTLIVGASSSLAGPVFVSLYGLQQHGHLVSPFADWITTLVTVFLALLTGIMGGAVAFVEAT